MKLQSARESGARDCDFFKKSLIIIVLIGGAFFPSSCPISSAGQ